MPYKIVKTKNKFKVQKKDGSKTFGTHTSRKKAQKQVAALHLNVKENNAFDNTVIQYLKKYTGME